MTISGLWPPVATPFNSDFSINISAFLAHCHSLLDAGATGLAVLGTTSEANSLSMNERVHLLAAMLDDGIAAGSILPGTGACSVPEAVEMSRRATETGCAGVLLLPPFFYKSVTDEGLFDYVARVVDGVSNPNLRIYLYHIPQMAGAGWSLDLIAKLRMTFPETVVGLKDSAGDWENTRAFIERFPEMAVFPANEAHLSMAVPLGAAGCISATANINTANISNLLAGLSQGRDMTAEQQRITVFRQTVSAYPLVPAVKTVMAEAYQDPNWILMRPPLRPLAAEAREALLHSLDLSNARKGELA